jgi:hypothetical protein
VIFSAINNKKYTIHQRKPGCKYYEQYQCYNDADVIIFNSLKYKIESFAHSELNNDEIKNNLEDNVLNLKSFFNDTSFQIVEIDSTYPQYLLDNLTKYDNLILKPKK